MGLHICIFPNQSLRSWLWKMQIYGPTFYRSLAQEEIVNPNSPSHLAQFKIHMCHFRWLPGRAVTVLDRDRSNSPERRTRTEVFFIFRTLVLKFRKFGISHSQNPSKFAFYQSFDQVMMLIARLSYSFSIKHSWNIKFSSLWYNFEFSYWLSGGPVLRTG